MTILITGFDAFGDHASNPAEHIVRRLAGEEPTLLLPTRYDRAAALALDAIERLRPETVVMFGLAAKRQTMELERFALNIIESPVPDNDGVVGAGLPVVADGPAAYRTSVDLVAVRGRMAVAGHAVGISNHAGSYVCNHLYYSVLHALAERGQGPRAVFVHVPWSYEPCAAGEARLAQHERKARALIAAL
jgi:pyroglutamyl-peptidase